MSDIRIELLERETKNEHSTEPESNPPEVYYYLSTLMALLLIADFIVFLSGLLYFNLDPVMGGNKQLGMTLLFVGTPSIIIIILSFLSVMCSKINSKSCSLSECSSECLLCYLFMPK